MGRPRRECNLRRRIRSGFHALHAVNRLSPYFSGYPGFTRRPALIDAIEWVNDWPEVRGGYWASNTLQPAPAAQPGQISNHQPAVAPDDQPGQEIPGLSDEFNSTTLSPQWHFIHPNANNAYTLTGSSYEVETMGPDENGDRNMLPFSAARASRQLMVKQNQHRRSLRQFLLLQLRARHTLHLRRRSEQH